MFRHHVFECRGPLQTYRSSWRQEQQNSNVILCSIELILEFADALGAEILQRGLTGRSLAPAIQVEDRCGHQRDWNRTDNVCSFHWNHRVPGPAIAFATNCGNKMEIKTKPADTHNRTNATVLVWRLHFRARRAR